MMKEEYKLKILQVGKDKRQIKQSIKILRKLRKGDVDRKIHQLHHQAFEKIDCLKCANCCKTTGPLFTQKDISSIASN